MSTFNQADVPQYYPSGAIGTTQKSAAFLHCKSESLVSHNATVLKQFATKVRAGTVSASRIVDDRTGAGTITVGGAAGESQQATRSISFLSNNFNLTSSSSLLLGTENAMFLTDGLRDGGITSVTGVHDAGGGGGGPSTYYACISQKGFLSRDESPSGKPILYVKKPVEGEQLLAGAEAFEAGDFVLVADTPFGINTGLYVVESASVVDQTVTIRSQPVLYPQFAFDFQTVSFESLVPGAYAAPDTSDPVAECLYGALIKVSVSTIRLSPSDGNGAVPQILLQRGNNDTTYTSFITEMANSLNVTNATVLRALHDDLQVYQPSMSSPFQYLVDVGSAGTLEDTVPAHENLIICGKTDYSQHFVGDVDRCVLLSGDQSEDKYPFLHTGPIVGNTFAGNNCGLTVNTSENTAAGYYACAYEPAGGVSALGSFAGEVSAGYKSTMVGHRAGNLLAGTYSVSIGSHAGEIACGDYSVNVGAFAGQNYCGTDSVSIGFYSGQDYKGARAVSIGARSSMSMQGEGAIAIGHSAAPTNQPARSIAIGAGCQTPGAEGRLAFGAGLDGIKNTASAGTAQAMPAAARGFIRLEWNGELVCIPVFSEVAVV